MTRPASTRRQRRSGRLGFACLLVCLSLLPGLPAAAQTPRGEAGIRIGVLAFRAIEHSRERWTATAAHLQAALPDYRVELTPMHTDELDRAVAGGELDFVLTQPEHYVQLRARHGLAAIATLMPLANGRPVTQFGGVIFARADRSDIRTLPDVHGKRVAAIYEHSLGAFRMQQWTLLKAGVELPRDAALHFTGQPQDRAVFEVLDGRADVGFVRTGVLEALAAEGRVRLDEFFILNRQAESRFPQLLSTELYPEWPFSALRGVPEEVVKAVGLALLNIPSDSAAARSGNYYGFSPPGDYTPLEAVLLRLRAHPDRLEHFDLQDIAEKYAQPIAGGLTLLLMLAILAVFRLMRANRRERAAAEERALLIGSLGEGVYGVDAAGRCSFVNPAALAMLGFTEADMIGHSPHALFHHHHPDGREYPHADCPVHKTLADGRHREGEEWFFRKDGHGFAAQVFATAMQRDGRIVGAVVAFQDISGRKRAEADLRIAAAAFETQEGIIITDAAGRIVRVNQAFTRVTGFGAEEAIGRTPALFKSGRHDRAFYEQMWQSLQQDGCWQGEIWNRRKTGEIYPEWLTISAVRGDSGEICHYVGAFLDISQRKQAEEQIQYLAFYDPLTKLPNRSLLIERLGQALASSARAAQHGALLFIDLDNFKTLNDTLGHDMGDRLLVQVAQRLRDAVRATDTVARLGGDEFVVMLEGLADHGAAAAGQAEMIGEKIRERLARPYHFGATEHYSAPSIGIALFRDPGDGIDELLKRGDLAMYQAKEAGGNAVRFFDPAMQAAVEARARLESDLRKALANGEFFLHYQLQFDADGEPVGAEALLRWQHPERGLVGPAEFIPLAEATGLILPIGQWVLDTACRQLAAWQDSPATAGLHLSVNVSPRQFRQPGFAEQVAAALEGNGAAARGLQLEITESLLLENLDDTIDRMTFLRTLGVGFALDDFGTGYSSLAYLKRLPLQQLKIDRSFVRDVLTDPNDAAITRTILALGRSLGLAVVAEGVETEAQRDFLIREGCLFFQGYYFARPTPASQLLLDLACG